MRNRLVLCSLVIFLLIAFAASLDASRKEPVVAPPSSAKDGPPPGAAMSLSVPQARTMLKETLRQLFVGQAKCHIPMVGSTNAPSNGRPSEVLFEPRAFDAIETNNRELHFDLKTDQEYLEGFHPLCYSCGGPKCYGVHPLSRRHPDPSFGLLWLDEAAAQKFADAFNRLLYAAHQNEDLSGIASFIAAAKAWRENPVKPPLSPETDRQRILAENALKEKNLGSAVEHYEAAVEIQPVWPAGWFNLALLYAEQKNYADATDAMKHYLELVPDASDAQAAREQMIIWEDKARH